MELIYFWKATSCSATQEFPKFMESENSLPCSQEPSTGRSVGIVRLQTKTTEFSLVNTEHKENMAYFYAVRLFGLTLIGVHPH
jgi:hypothetical protein